MAAFGVIFFTEIVTILPLLLVLLSPLSVNFISLPCNFDPLQLQISYLPSHTSEIDS